MRLSLSVVFPKGICGSHGHYSDVDRRTLYDQPVGKTLRRFTDHENLRMESYRYWASRSMGEVFDAVAEMSQAAWQAWYKQHETPPHAEGSARTLTRIQRTIR